MKNEIRFRKPAEVVAGIEAIYQTMLDCVFRGCRTAGILPGGLNVKRRAKKLADSLLKTDNFDTAEQWLAAIWQKPKSFTLTICLLFCQSVRQFIIAPIKLPVYWKQNKIHT